MTVLTDPPGQDARTLAALAPALGTHVHIALDGARTAQISALLGFFAPEVEVVTLPAWDCLPYDRVGPHPDVTAARLAALARMLEPPEGPRIVLTTAHAAVQRLPPPEAIREATMTLRVGEDIADGALSAFCARAGYVRVPTVREPGQWARRGGIVDIFPPAGAVRVDLFGDTVESLRALDAATQLSGAALSGLALGAAAEYALDEQSIARFRTAWRASGLGPSPVYDAVSEGRAHGGVEHWLPLFYARMAVLGAYVPGAEGTWDPGVGPAGAARLAQIADFHAARADLAAKGGPPPLPPELLYLTAQEWEQGVQTPREEDAKDRASWHSWRPGASEEGCDRFAELKTCLCASQAKTVLLAAYSAGSRDRLAAMLEHAGIGPLALCEAFADARPGRPNLAVLPVEHGFSAPDWVLITECNLLGAPLARPPKKRRKVAQDCLQELSTLSPGDLVVHVDHGVGRFVALETLAVGKALHDCLKLEYAGGDRLFVPVANMDLLSRFGAGEAALDKLGGAGWQARKAQARRNALEIAADLMAREAARHERGTEPLAIDPDAYAAFAARFPYAETEDQARAIEDVLADMAADKPMDRLICGDVGFGKTEVAMRAAFVAAKAGAQVAVIVPTTLLARQHFETFTARFINTGLSVAHLSRMVGTKEAARVKVDISDGSVRIVVGTHALLSDKIRFQNLGLIVVDEEQHFGVKQKEKLKSLRTGVHVLSLSATPIPRTLHMALSSVRAMSVIATPPVDRLAIRSFVAPFDPIVVREALTREYQRGGQAFVVCPRVADIPEMEETLRDLVPGMGVLTAHGQMPPKALEERVGGFYDGRADILLSTPIIESGLDVPRANTLIVWRSDMFGLAQLYQIRGRVGRGRERAYAYLTYDGTLTEPAQKRLAVMETLDSLGAGFQLATHDLDIRGAGNLLGAQQSGHVREVGMELYQQMLAEAIAALREGGGGVQEDAWSPQVKIGVSALIPKAYVPDVGVRMGLYRRLSGAAETAEREALAAELIDRFGPLPAEAQNLLRVLEIKALARRCGLAKVEAGGGGALLAFHKDHMPRDPQPVLAWARSAGAQVRADSTIAIPASWGIAQRLPRVQAALAGLAQALGI